MNMLPIYNIMLTWYVTLIWVYTFNTKQNIVFNVFSIFIFYI